MGNNLNYKRYIDFTMDSDDDLPPDLEDFSEKLEHIK